MSDELIRSVEAFLSGRRDERAERCWLCRRTREEAARELHAQGSPPAAARVPRDDRLFTFTRDAGHPLCLLCFLKLRSDHAELQRLLARTMVSGEEFNWETDPPPEEL